MLAARNVDSKNKKIQNLTLDRRLKCDKSEFLTIQWFSQNEVLTYSPEAQDLKNYRNLQQRQYWIVNWE